jgi:glutamate synthase (NADPH/NADH) large chain
MIELFPGDTDKQNQLDLRPIISDAGVAPEKPQFCTEARNQPFDQADLAREMLTKTLPAIETKSGGDFDFRIHNYDRTIGASISGEIARRYGNEGMDDAPLNILLHGTAGQSLGAWNVSGLNLDLVGDANDYVGKGMAGGQIIVRPPTDALFVANDTVIVGNTCLYGATGGQFFAAGQSGERFAVRNSGALAVVEGSGDHCCEYMTGGVVVVLGRSGVNFGAGLTGGFAYVLDLDRDFVDLYNHELIDIHRITPESMESHLHHLNSLIMQHVEYTGSKWGGEILEDFRTFLPKFWVVKSKAAELGSLIESLRQAA